MKGNQWAKSMDFFVTKCVLPKWQSLFPLCQKELKNTWMDRLKSNRDAWRAESLNELSTGFEGAKERKLRNDKAFAVVWGRNHGL